MKLIIEDLVKRHTTNEPETELPINTCIRFENGNRKIRISINQLGQIELIEVGDSDYALNVSPAAPNKIIVFLKRY